jgi:hypothetical protein
VGIHRGVAASRDGLDGRPAHEARALLGDPTSDDLRIRLSVGRRKPCLRAEPFGTGEARHVADFGHEDRPQDGTHPLIAWIARYPLS